MSEQHENEPGQGNSLFAWIRYVLICVLSAFLIYCILFPSQKAPDVSDATKPENVIAEPLLHFRGTTMGSVPYSVKIAEPVPESPENEARFRTLVQETLEHVDASMSTFRPDSEVSRFNASDSTEWFPMSPDTLQVVKTAQEISELTEGRFDITVGPLVNRWGFGPEKHRSTPTQEELGEILKSVGYRHLSLRENPPAVRKDVPGVKIDLSGIAKGFAVDLLARNLEKKGVENYLIEIGGETRTRGEKSEGRPWTIGIEIPTPAWLNEPKIQRLAHLGSKSMATSGDYHNFIDYQGIRFSHIIDPRTGWPTEKQDMEIPESRVRLGSLSVVDSSCVRADALTKGFYLLGVEDGLKFANRHGIAVLFLLRKENWDQKDPGPKFTIEEVLSEAFEKEVDSWKPGERN